MLMALLPFKGVPFVTDMLEELASSVLFRCGRLRNEVLEGVSQDIVPASTPRSRNRMRVFPWQLEL